MSSSRVVLVTVLVASTGVARAGDKYKRTPAVNVTVNFSDRVKPVQPHASTAAPQPGLDADAVLDLEGRLGSVRGEQEQILLDLIQQTPDRDVDEKCDYYFRLAELYAKQQRYFRLEAAKAQIAADKDPKRKAELDKLAASNAARSHQYLVAAVRTYKALADNDLFRNYPKMDMALFYYGYTLQSGAYVKEARAVYDKLLASYPSSKYVPEAHLAFADYFFENNQLDDAEARYKQVLEFPHASVYWYAMYKMGWIHLNKQRFQEALETFYQVALATRGDRKQVILNRAAKKDFVRAYAEIGKADQAWNAFKRVDAGYALDMLQILADLYLEQGKSDRAIYTYRDLMKREPTSASVCQWQYDVAHAMLSMPGASNADKVGEIENLTHLWRALASRPLPAAAKQECHDDAAAMSGELARAYHSESVRTLNVETFGYAERLYRAYLDAFPDADDFAQTQYFYAELQWSRATLERDARRQVALWQRAANAFTDVVKLGKVEPRLLKESAYAAVLGWKNALDIDPRPKQQAADDDPKAYTVKPEPLPIPEPEQKMIAAFELYITYVKDPKDPDVVGMKFSEANTLRRYNHFREAIPIFEDIVFHHAEHEAAPTAANLLLDIYNRQQNYDDMLALVDKLSALPLGKTDELAPVLAKLRAQSLEKRAQLLEKQGKFVACGLAYEDIYNTKPEDPGNDVVLYNAGTCFEEGKSIGAAIKMFDTLERYYASSKLAARALARLGKDYADLAFYDQAAERYEQYAKKFAGEKDAFDVLSDATMFRKGTGADDKAIADTKYFVDAFGRTRPAEAASAAYALASVYEKRGDRDAVIAQLRDYVRAWGARGGQDRLVIAHARIAGLLWHAACPVAEVDGACVKVVRERAIATRYAAKKTKDLRLHCGPQTKLTLVRRDERKLREALAEVDAAEAAFARLHAEADPGFGGARYWFAQSKLIQADALYERFLAIEFPGNLDFDPAPEHKAIRARSQARLTEWLDHKRTAAAAANAAYGKVLAIRDNASSIAAAAREGQITQTFSDQLAGAEVPKDVRSGEFAQDKVDAYCDALTDLSEPLADKSLAAYRACLTRSTELGWFSDWSKLCERELGQLRPDEFPTASELRADPSKVAQVIAGEPPPAL